MEHQKEYAYQTGEAAPQGDIGCTLDEAAVALACAAPDVSLAVQAKREVGMLYEDIAKPPYTAIFNPSTTAKALWRAVTVLRLCEAQLKDEQQQGSGKERLIAIHGNRFVLHIVFHVLRTKWPQGSTDESELAATVKSTVSESLATTIQNIVEHYSGAYPASLFKNASKCRDLKRFVTESGHALPNSTMIGPDDGNHLVE